MLDQTQRELLNTVEEEDIRFIRLAYCDLFGRPKNMAIMSSQLKKAFEEGIPADAGKIAGFEKSSSPDVFLVPDSSTASILPWRPSHDRVMRLMCDLRTADGQDSVFSSRKILKDAVQEASDMGYIINAGTQCEFTLFRTDETGQPERLPFDYGSFDDVAPLDRGEDIRRDICLSLEKMGLGPVSSHHESGHGQNVVDFRYSDVQTAADDFLTFRMAVKAVSGLHGAYASFLPKPFPDDAGNGLHINLSLLKGGKNVFLSRPEHSETGEAFIAGILSHIREMTAFLNPIPNSYERFGKDCAPGFVDWGYRNAAYLIRIPTSASGKVRLELRSPDPSCNLYLALSLIIRAGLDGIRKDMPLQTSGDVHADHSDSQPLPATLGEAIEIAKESVFIRESLPDCLLDTWFSRKEQDWREYDDSANGHESEMKKYFYIL